MSQPPTKAGQVARPRAYHQFLDKEHPKDYRHEEVEALARAIRARENRLVLGLPGMGISNLLRFLLTREGLFARPVIFAYLDCDGLDGCLDFGAFFEEIARQLHEQGLGDQRIKQVRGYERLKWLLERVEGDPLGRVVIVADQTDSVLKAADKGFYRKLKALTNLNKRVCYIFAASPSLADRVDPDNLLFAGRKLTVGRLNERDCASAIQEESRRLGVEFDPVTQGRLARLTGGHPGLLRAVSSAADEEGLDTSDAEATWVERLSTREEVQYRCLKVWKELGPAQRAALRSLAEGRQSNAVRVDTLAWLQGFGLVDEQEGSYRLFSPLFLHIIATQEIPSEPITQEMRLEPHPQETPPEPVRIDKPTQIVRNGQEIIVTGKVFKGDQEVHVSRLELRLIACLKRERKIFSKDDIARYVYYDEYERGGGISDRRIENLVRQVRKRLGKEYIKAYWGQGYEFLG